MRSSLFLASAALAGAVAPPAHAGSASAAMEVGATVTDGCSVSATPMAFTIESRAAGPALARSSIALSCTPEASFEIAFDRGNNPAGETRRMADPATGEYLAYEIYSDPARTARWGDRTGIDTVGGMADASGTMQFAVYGEVRRDGAPPAPGSYSDSVVVTVNF